MLLTLDTATPLVTVALHDGSDVVAEHLAERAMKHGEQLAPLIERCLLDVGAVRQDLTAIGVGVGPGPFTGLRVGIAAARTFALGRGIPVVPVVSHDATALGILLDQALAGETDAERFAIVTDARRRELAYTVYEGMDDDGLPVRVTEPALTPRDEIEAVLAGLGAERRDTTAVSAAMVALVAARSLAAGREVGPRDALYLRSPDVTISAGPKKVGV